MLATVAASLWVIHPLASEPVVYTLQRTELLASLFYLLTLWCAIRSWATPRAGIWAAAAVAACALGMGSKEIMVSAPILVLLYDRTFVSDSFAAAFKRHRVLYVGLAVTWIIMVGLYGSAPRGRSVSLSHADLTPLDYLRTQAEAILLYLRRCFCPYPLSIVYDWPVVRSWSTAAPFGLAVLMLLAGTGWAIYRRWALGVAGALFFMVLAPSSSFVPMVTEFVAERRMYLPLAAVVSTVVIGGYVLCDRVACTLANRSRQYAMLGLAGILMMLLTLTTARRVDDYRSEMSIWENALVQYPHSGRALGAAATWG